MRSRNIHLLLLLVARWGPLITFLPRKRFALMVRDAGSRGDIKNGVKVTYSMLTTALLIENRSLRKGDYLANLLWHSIFSQDLVESEIRYLPLYPDDFEQFSMKIFSKLS